MLLESNLVSSNFSAEMAVFVSNLQGSRREQVLSSLHAKYLAEETTMDRVDYSIQQNVDKVIRLEEMKSAMGQICAILLVSPSAEVLSCCIQIGGTTVVVMRCRDVHEELGNSFQLITTKSIVFYTRST